MTLGLEGKKAKWALGVMFVVLGYEFYSNVLAGPSTSVSPGARVAAPPPGENPEESPAELRARAAARGHDEFLPKLHDKRGAKPLDPTTIDPTLHTELLAKLDAVPPAGSGRDLFSFGKPAPVLTDPEPKVKVATVIGPPAPPPKPVAQGPAPPPPPPPINLKYYGIVTTLSNGKKTAFFMDGDEILLETEGMTFKGRYRLVRVGVSSAVVEDIQYKHEQTLPITEEAQGG
jgi:hypothetical protein